MHALWLRNRLLDFLTTATAAHPQGGVAGFCAALRDEAEKDRTDSIQKLQARQTTKLITLFSHELICPMFCQLATAMVEAKHNALETIRRQLLEEEACPL